MDQTVTIIIPVLNAASMLKKVLGALSRQTYPLDLIEIIVVDNGSSDDSPDVAESCGVKLLYEDGSKSPYSARNLGLQHASGSIIALTDANKIPEKDWIKEGVRAIIQESADLVGGDIKFDLDENSTSAELYDAITYNNNRKLVIERQSSVSGNLFFKRKVVEEIGPFPGKYRSGMDVWWSHQAVQKGFKLIFAEHAVVRCQPRKLNALLHKSWRVGKLHPINFRQEGRSLSYILQHTFRTFAPPKINDLKRRLSELEQTGSLIKIFSIGWMCKIMMGFGRIRGLFYLKKELKTKSG